MTESKNYIKPTKQEVEDFAREFTQNSRWTRLHPHIVAFALACLERWR